MARSKLRKEESTNTGNKSIGDISTPMTRAYDESLATLFENSLGPVKPFARSLAASASLPTKSIKSQSPDSLSGRDDPEDISDIRNPIQDNNQKPEREGVLDFGNNSAKTNRKRKRTGAEDDVEGRYLKRVAREEAVEEQRRDSKLHQKLQKADNSDKVRDKGPSSSSIQRSNAESVNGFTGTHNGTSEALDDVPRHESLVTSKEDLDLEKSSRTVFLANVATLAIKSKTAKRILLEHLASFTPSLPKQDVRHGIESLRFRSTAFASTGVPKKAAFAKKELMDTTTKSTNAYAVYTTQLAAREAAKQLNGSNVLDRHLRVDLVAHPAKIDHRRCVFVGNLGFVDDETNINAAEDEENGKPRRKAKEAADIEEGLWRQFGKAGLVESVRVVRDKTTRVGKGFAYVQYEDANAVEKALLFNEKKFPPMLPRILRVTRAKNLKKTGGQKERKRTPSRKGGHEASYNAKIPSEVQSLSGRAGKLLGRAGAAQMKTVMSKSDTSSRNTVVAKTPESIVFEGHRASRLGKGMSKMGGSSKSQEKRTRSSRRGAEFKARGGKKAKS